MELMSTHSLIGAALVAVMGLAALTDTRRRRIPNWISAGGLVLALALRAYPGGPGLMEGLAGAGLGFALGLGLFALGGFGGGDAKLLWTAGAFLGPRDFGWSLLAMAIAGGAIALGVLLRRRLLVGGLLSAWGALRHLLTLGRSGFWPNPSSESAITIPYGVAIAIGAVFAWFTPILVHP